MNENTTYIDKLLSLSKESYFLPFRVEWLPLYGTIKQVVYLADSYFEEGEEYQGENVIVAGTRFQEILDLLLPGIAAYPYNWSLEGQKLDVSGYDFELNSSSTILEIGVVAKEEVWNRLGLVAPSAPLASAYTQAETVTGGHLTKFSLSLEKASPISLLSFRMQSTLPVRLASLLYESDISGYSEAQKVNLDLLQIEQSAENITLLFGQPIFAKRLTFVLAQDNAKANTYYASQSSEDFTYRSTEQDQTLLEQLLLEDGETTVYTTENIYTDEEIEDWSEERKKAYFVWRAQKLASFGE